MLDLGAGTGRVALALAEAGFGAVGLELSAAMLAAAERKRALALPEVAARCRFVAGDMAGFDLGRRFARVLIPFRGFNHLMTAKQRIGCLRAVRAHLAPGGAGAMHLATVDDPAAMTAANAGRHIRVQPADSDLMLHWELVDRRLDVARRWLEQDVRLTLERPDGSVARGETATYRIAWTPRGEVAPLLAACGLTVIEERAGFGDGPSPEGMDHIVVFRRDDDG